MSEVYKRQNWEDPVKAKIEYRDGKLSMIDGSDLGEHLRSWARVCDRPEGQQVVVVPVEMYREMKMAYLCWGWG